MNINIENERVNRLLHRTELKCTIETDGVTPSRKDLIKQIAAKKGVNENLVVIDRIDQEYGQKFANAYVKVYESEKAAQTIELKHKVERDKKALTVEEKPAEKAPAEAPKAEEAAPAEEKPAEEKAEAKAPVEEKPAEEAPAEKKKEGEE